MTNESRISAGSFDLNKFLSGGYETDIISTIYGPGGSGKSNFCMIVAVSQAKKGNKIIYVDTEGGFSTDRFKQIHRGEKEKLEKDLQNVLILKPTNFPEQEKAFETLLSHVKKGDVSLIIIDSLTMLYRLELGEAINTNEDIQIQKVNRKLANQLRTLNEIARKQNLPILVTNQVYSTFQKGADQEENKIEKKVSMVGGDLLKYWSKCLLELSQYGQRRKITIRKHRSLPEKSLAFEIINSGIRKKGLF